MEEYGYVYAWKTLGNIATGRLTEDADFGKKNHLFWWNSFWYWRVRKQAKLLHLGHIKPVRVHWKADAPKTSHCLVRILVQSHNWAIFRRKWAKRGRYSQWRSLSGHVERIFIHKNWIGGYWHNWFQQDGASCHTAEATLDVLRSVFEDRIISRNLTPLDCYLWGAVKDKCDADKSETIDALKNNIREVDGEKYSCTQSIMSLKIGPIM